MRSEGNQGFSPCCLSHLTLEVFAGHTNTAACDQQIKHAAFTRTKQIIKPVSIRSLKVKWARDTFHGDRDLPPL